MTQQKFANLASLQMRRYGEPSLWRALVSFMPEQCRDCIEDAAKKRAEEHRRSK
jgi:hypothetical protein